MTRELGVQFARQRVRVTALCPGPVDTPLLPEWPTRGRPGGWRVPTGRFAEPGGIAAAVAFPAGDDASFVTASASVVDGGITAASVTPL